MSPKGAFLRQDFILHTIKYFHTNLPLDGCQELFFCKTKKKMDDFTSDVALIDRGINYLEKKLSYEKGENMAFVDTFSGDPFLNVTQRVGKKGAFDDLLFVQSMLKLLFTEATD